MKRILAILVVGVFACIGTHAAQQPLPADSIRVYYHVGYRTLDMSYRENRAELDRLAAVLQDALAKGKLEKVVIRSYASPIGTNKANERLTVARAEVLKDSIRKYADLPESQIELRSEGIAWPMLHEMVAASQMPARDEVLRIIDQCSGDPDACEERIKALVPPEIYQRVLNEMYGPLRRNEYRIEYNVRHFDLKEAQELVRTRPDLLSVAEIQKVADSYGTGSPAYIETLQVAARTYPDNRTAQNNCALALIEAQEYTAAIALLKGTTDGALLNFLGVAYAKAHQYDEAKDAFNRAKEAGYAPAKDNLQRMEEAIALFN